MKKTSGELNFYRGESTCSVAKQFGGNGPGAKRTFTKERLWANLRKGHSCIPGYGKPSDFFTLTGQHSSATYSDEKSDMVVNVKCS